jgi:putative glutamine amidotransferase
MAFKPLIGVTACVKQIGLHPYHVSGDKYLRAVSVAALGLPVVIPSLGDLTETDALLAQLDGLLLTGSPSNVEPFHYQGPASAPGTDHDPQRDATTLPLLRAAIAAGVPVLGICRGFQEMNVAFGGSLHQKVHELPGPDLAVQYAAAHAVTVQPGGVFEALDLPQVFQVNSIHSQGIDRLAPGLRAEAIAPDGLIEAISVEHSKTFAVGVQWHPEWQVLSNPPYLSIFQAFGEACRQRAALRNTR